MCIRDSINSPYQITGLGGANITGVITATTFSGSGASLTNLPAANITGTLPAISGANLTSLPAQATIANNADNRVITGGSGVNLNGEENLTWDGSLLTADKGSSNGSVLQCRNDDDTAYSSAAEGHLNSVLSLQSTTPGGQNDQSVAIQFNLGLSGQTGSIQEIGAVRTGNGAGALIFRTRNSSSGRVERLRIASDGDVTISDGDLVIGTAGHGIDFSATSDASGSTSELLDDYEEGSWTATVTYSNSGSATLSESLGFYTKIGNQVHIQAAITFSAQGSGSGNVMINGLPFTSSGDNGKRINGFMTYATGFSSLNSIPVLYVAGAYTYMEPFHLGQSNGTATGITNVTRNNCSSNTTIRLYAAYTV